MGRDAGLQQRVPGRPDERHQLGANAGAPHNGAMAQAHDRVSDAFSLVALVRHQLILLGEDPSREGLRDTPERVKQSLEFLTRGYRMSLGDVFGDATFTQTYKDMIVV